MFDAVGKRRLRARRFARHDLPAHTGGWSRIQASAQTREAIARVEAALRFRPAVCPLVVAGNVEQRVLQAVEPAEAPLVPIVAARTPENVADMNGKGEVVPVHVPKHEGIAPVFPRVIWRVAERAEC